MLSRLRAPDNPVGFSQFFIAEEAGFFSDEELAESDGIIWSAETGEHTQNPRLDPPALSCRPAPFSRKDLSAFAEGDVTACFGAGFEPTYTHTRMRVWV